jgi:hypothetical protein
METSSCTEPPACSSVFPPAASTTPRCFYNKRGIGEQWIKEVKQAVAMTWLSCHRFRSNEVRLWNLAQGGRRVYRGA